MDFVAFMAGLKPCPFKTAGFAISRKNEPYALPPCAVRVTSMLPRVALE